MGIAALLREQANGKPVLRSHHRPQQAARERRVGHTNSHNAAPASSTPTSAPAFEVGLFRGRNPK